MATGWELIQRSLAVRGWLKFKNDIMFLSGSGAPSDGTSGTGAGEAGPGSQYHRTSNGALYRNTNTKASPTWTLVGTVSAGSVTATELDSGAVTGAKVGVMAEDDLEAGPAVTLVFDVPDGATGNVDKVITSKMVVTDAYVIVNGTNGANANTIQVDNGTGGTHITDEISTNGKSAGDIVRAVSLINRTISAGATLRIVRTRAGGANAAKVVVYGYKSA